VAETGSCLILLCSISEEEECFITLDTWTGRSTAGCRGRAGDRTCCRRGCRSRRGRTGSGRSSCGGWSSSSGKNASPEANVIKLLSRNLRMGQWVCPGNHYWWGRQASLQWPMGGKAKCRCQLGMLKVNKFRHSNLNLMKLENYGPTGECLKNNHCLPEWNTWKVLHSRLGY